MSKLLGLTCRLGSMFESSLAAATPSTDVLYSRTKYCGEKRAGFWLRASFLSRFLSHSFRRNEISRGFLWRLTICSVVVACAGAALAQTPDKVYFSDDFENGTSNWEASSGTWGLITTDFRSSSHSISASPGQNYALNANSILAIPPTNAIDLTNATHPYLSFWHKYSIASTCLGGPIYCTTYYDYGYVEVSTNYGVTWTQIASFTGEITSWTPQELDLTPYIGNKILVRFRLWDGGYGNVSWGWFLDDVEVREKGPLTVGVTVSVSPSGGGTITGTGISCPGTCAVTFPSNWNLSGRDWALIDTDYETPPASISASPNGNYALYANSTLELANAVDISKATAPALSYWDKYSITSTCLGGPIYCTTYYDYGYVEVSQDYGVTWTQLTKENGLVSDWTPETLDLTPYITGGPILIRYRLWDGGYGNVGWGWEVDDVEITDLPTGTVYFSDNFSSPTSVPDFSDLTLTATPSPGYALPTWTGCNSTDENQCIINQYIDRVVGATFATAPAPTIGFTVPNQTYGTGPFTVAATSNSAGAFTYTVVSGPASIVGATVTLTGVGTVVLQASQAASSDYAAGTKQAAFTVVHGSQTIDFPAIAAQTVLTSVTLSATASSGLTVSFTSLTTSVCTVSGNSASLLEAGTCTIQASQSGNDDYLAAPKVNLNISVTHLAQTITFPAIAAKPALSTVTLTATASSGLTVNYTSLTTSVCTVSGNSASLLEAGTCTIQASQSGNDVYLAAPKVNLSISVTHVAQTIDFPAIAAKPALSTVTLSATASSGLTVNYTSLTTSVCTVSGNSASLLESGTCTIQASQSGNDVYLAAPKVNLNISVTHLAQTITFPAIAAKPALSTVTLSATASSGLTVSFTSLTTSVCTVSGNSASLLESGTCTIQASQSGNDVYLAAPKVNLNISVTHLAQTIDFPAIAAKPALSTVTLSATASSGLTVSFTSLTTSVCTVSGNSASLLEAGTCTIQASQTGNDVYLAAPKVNLNISVTHLAQTIDFPAIATQTVNTTVTLSATTSSGLAVSYTSLTTSVCTVTGNTASLLETGTCTIQASQPGNGVYLAAARVSQSFTVKAD
jgi:hypothetical protein